MYSDAVARALGALIVGVSLVSFTLGGLVFWGVPKLWGILRPWLHAVTG